MKRHKPDQPSPFKPASPPEDAPTLATTLHTDADASEVSETSQRLAKHVVEIPAPDVEIADVNALADAPQLAIAEATDRLSKESKRTSPTVYQHAIDALIRESKAKANTGNGTPAQRVNKRVGWHQPTHQTTAYICESALPIGGARKATGDVAREKEVATGLPIAPPPSTSSQGNDDSTR